jgi:hypothetical protein
MHDFIDAKISERIQYRFSATHRITVVDVAPRRHDDSPWVSEADFDWAVDESRPVKPHPMQWAVLVPLMVSKGRALAERFDSRSDVTLSAQNCRSVLQ